MDPGTADLLMPRVNLATCGLSVHEEHVWFDAISLRVPQHRQPPFATALVQSFACQFAFMSWQTICSRSARGIALQLQQTRLL